MNTLEDTTRYSAPPDRPEYPEIEISGYDRGREDRIACLPRCACPFFRYEETKAEWLRGWDFEDIEL
jgi:ribosome modulation factor